MGSSVRCFVVTETPSAALSLRRYRSRSTADDGCAGRLGYHDASTTIDADYEAHRRDDGYMSAVPDSLIAPDDPRWPAACTACGAPFDDTDRRQVNIDPWYEGLAPDGTGDLIRATLRHLPAGALFRMPWADDTTEAAGNPTGEAWGLVLPPGPTRGDSRPHVWHVYGPATQTRPLPGWTVTGTPPNLTASPSIDSGDWHGHLTDGVLRD